MFISSVWNLDVGKCERRGSLMRQVGSDTLSFYFSLRQKGIRWLHKFPNCQCTAPYGMHYVYLSGVLCLCLYICLCLCFCLCPLCFFFGNWWPLARAYIHKSSGAVVSEEETVPIKKSKNQARKSSHAKQHYSLFRNLLRAEHWESVKCLQKINSIRKKVMKLDRMNRRVFVLVRSNFLLVANKIKLARHLHDKSAGVKKIITQTFPFLRQCCWCLSFLSDLSFSLSRTFLFLSSTMLLFLSSQMWMLAAPLSQQCWLLAKCNGGRGGRL